MPLDSGLWDNAEARLHGAGGSPGITLVSKRYISDSLCTLQLHICDVMCPMSSTKVDHYDLKSTVRMPRWETPQPHESMPLGGVVVYLHLRAVPTRIGEFWQQNAVLAHSSAFPAFSPGKTCIRSCFMKLLASWLEALCLQAPHRRPPAPLPLPPLAEYTPRVYPWRLALEQKHHTRQLE